MPNYSELLRLINNLIRTGTVESIAAEEGSMIMITVKSGDNITGFIPWVAARAGASKSWNPPSVGEQVILLSPGGNLEQAFAIGGLFSSDKPAPSQNINETVYELPDGSLVKYNHEDHKLTVNIDGSADIAVTGEASVNAEKIKLNDGSGVVTGAHICQFTGTPHTDCSITVLAGP